MITKIKKVGVAVASTVALAPYLVMAQPGGIQPVSPRRDEGSFAFLLDTIFAWAFGLLIVLAAFFILWAGFLFLTGGDDENKRKDAKNYIIYALVAIVVGGVAYILVGIVRRLVGV